MKSIAKVAASALLAGGVALATAPANAAVHVGIGIPSPVYYPAPPPFYGPRPCYAYGPYACPRPVYYGPVYYRYRGPGWHGRPRLYGHPARYWHPW